MPRLLIAIALGFGLLASPAVANEALYQAIDEDYAYLEELYLYLHQNPELSYQEEQTMHKIAAELDGLGFDVTENVGGFGLVGVLKNGEGPTVMIRTDLDALPLQEQTGKPYASVAKAINQVGDEVFVMHACGHDIHMSAFVGTARRLVELKDQWRGTLVMIGQPAEERGGGARAMLEDGLYERFPLPDYNLALHDGAGAPAGMVGYTPGYALANVDSVDIVVHGIGGHGAYPHTTKDPVVLAAQIVVELQTLVSRVISPLEPGVVTVGSIHGGTKHNIISDEVKLQLTVRSYTDEVRATLLDGIKRIAENLGRAAGLPEDKLPEVTVREDEHTPSTYNDPALSERLSNAMRTAQAAGIIIETPPVMGGEDFSEFGRTDEKIPSFIFWIGAVNPEEYAATIAAGGTFPSLHSPFFAPDPEPTIKTGVRAMTIAALELLGKAE
ncbi:MAG: amidohydrolase [Sphingomonadales bacterium]